MHCVSTLRPIHIRMCTCLYTYDICFSPGNIYLYIHTYACLYVCNFPCFKQLHSFSRPFKENMLLAMFFRQSQSILILGSISFHAFASLLTKRLSYHSLNSQISMVFLVIGTLNFLLFEIPHLSFWCGVSYLIL